VFSVDFFILNEIFPETAKKRVIRVIDVFPKIFPGEIKGKKTPMKFIGYRSSEQVARPVFGKSPSIATLTSSLHQKQIRKRKFFKKPGKNHSEDNVPHQFQNSPNDLEIGS